MHYYEKLARMHDAQHRILDLVMVHTQMSRVFEYVEVGDHFGLAEYLVGFLYRLKAAGADFAVIPAVTPHFCLKELIAVSPLHLMSIFDPVVKQLAIQKARRVAIFGTSFVMESALFGRLGDVEVVPSSPHEAQYVHRTYVELARSRVASKEQHEGLAVLARKLLSREELDCIVLAGTDFSLLFDETNTDFPHIDCAAVHLQAIMNHCSVGLNVSPNAE